MSLCFWDKITEKLVSLCLNSRKTLFLQTETDLFCYNLCSFSRKSPNIRAAVSTILAQGRFA